MPDNAAVLFFQNRTGNIDNATGRRRQGIGFFQNFRLNAVEFLQPRRRQTEFGVRRTPPSAGARTRRVDDKTGINGLFFRRRHDFDIADAKPRQPRFQLFQTLRVNVVGFDHSLPFELRRQRQRIAELEAEEKSLAAEYEKTEQGVYLCEVFVKTKVALLTERINSKFKSVSFQLFREQTNGGLADCCEVLVPGEGGAMVPYSTANKAAVVNAGLEIIATLSHHYGVRLPIVVDNAESVTELLPVDSQVIRLVVSAEDESLRVEVDE